MLCVESLQWSERTSLITLTPQVKKNGHKRYMHLSVDSVQTPPGKSHVYILTCISTYMMSHFRNVISHGNFYKYDDVTPINACAHS